MAKFIPKILEPLLNSAPSDGVQNFISVAGKVYRTKIIADRFTRGFERVDRNGGINAYEHEKPDQQKLYRSNIEINRNDPAPELGYTFEANKKLSRINSETKDYISIVDIDFKPENDSDSRYYSYIKLPFVPRELNYSPESSFVGIASFGRNNPFYQFTGSEDTLTFEIDWFSEKKSRQDVVFNCRWIEALTKANGYDDVPHRVKLVWGRDNFMFDESIWIVTSAPVRYSDFTRGYKEGENFINTDMLPQQAYQTITLKKISEFNNTTSNIIGKRPQ